MQKTADIFKGEDDQWYLTLIAPNGEKILSSEGHKNRRDLVFLWNDYFKDWYLTINGVPSSEAIVREGGES